MIAKSKTSSQVRGTPFNQGDGFTLGAQVQAKLAGDVGGCHSTCWDADAPADAGDREITNQFTKSGYPLGIMVNAKGQRFADEGEDLRNYTYAKLGRIINDQPGGVAWQIYDSKTIPLLRVEEYADDIVRKTHGATLEELSQALTSDGLEDPQKFLKTMNKFNAAVAEDRRQATKRKFNPAVKDGLSAFGLDPPKSNWAQTISDGPFLAVKVACGITFTFYGLKIDPKTAAVVNTDDKLVEGLHCVGEMVSLRKLSFGYDS